MRAHQRVHPLLPATGAVFHGRYRIARLLRAGGMGAVYEAFDMRARVGRAVKVLLPLHAADADARARFKLEAALSHRVRSAHVAQVHDAGIDDATGSPFLVMDLLRGEDLGAILARRGRLAPAEVAAVLRQAAAGLKAAHDEGIVHRDVKPENLFVAVGPAGDQRLVVLDFGVAKLVASTVADVRTTRALGSPPYMPPEQIEGDGTIDGRADGYALAHVAYALLTGEAYWAKELQRRGMFNVLPLVNDGLPEPPSARARQRGVELPTGFDTWFRQATEAEMEGRFATMAELVAAATWAAPGALPVARTEPEDRSRGRVARAALVAALALLAIGLVSARPAPPPPAAAPAPATAEAPTTTSTHDPISLALASARGPAAEPSAERAAPVVSVVSARAHPSARPPARKPAPVEEDPTDVR